MRKELVIPITLSVVTILFFQHVNSGSVIVQSSSASGFSSGCGRMNCSSGHSCSESYSSIGENSTRVKSCYDLTGNYHREQITTTLVGNLECIINTTDVNGKVTTMKNCSKITPQELERRKEEWEKQMNMVTKKKEKLHSLLKSQEKAWEKQQQEMEQAFDRHEKSLERAMQEREKLWEAQEKAMDKHFEKLANLEVW